MSPEEEYSVAVSSGEQVVAEAQAAGAAIGVTFVVGSVLSLVAVTTIAVLLVRR